jgi:hypothetical protein
MGECFHAAREWHLERGFVKDYQPRFLFGGNRLRTHGRSFRLLLASDIAHTRL